MTLEYQLDSLEGIEESTASLYIEKDGKFVLDVTGHESAADKNKIPKSRLDQEIAKRKAAETGLQTVADGLKEDIPEEFWDLIPERPPAQLISWIRKMNSTGIFDSKEPDPIDNKRANDKKAADFEGMSPQAIMSKGYKT